MIRDYFERKKIWLSSSPGHIGLAFIVLLVTTLCGMLGFIFAGFLFMLSIAVFRSLEINELLPFSKKERKTRRDRRLFKKKNVFFENLSNTIL